MRGASIACLIAVAVVACGTETGDSTTIAAPATTSTTVPSTTTSTIGSPIDRATPLVTDNLMTELEDGTYLTFVDHVFTEGMMGGPELHFDLAAWFDGDDAIRHAAEDGAESPPPNDYYIRNVDPTVLVREVAAEVTVTSVWYHQSETNDLSSQPISFEELVEALTGEVDDSILAMRFSPWWVTIEDDVVVAIEEQYIP
jgi:hypothetical protein